MKKFKFLKILLIFAIFTILTPNIFANENNNWAKITKLSGDVSIKRSGGEKTFKAINNMRISGGDTIITGDNSKVSLLMSNNSKIIIDEKSIINISSIKKEIDKGKISQIDLKAGSIYNSVKEKLQDNDKYEVYTPNAVAGIRGTQFLVSFNHEKNLTIVSVDEGIVDMFRLPAIFNIGIQDNMRVLSGETGFGNDTPKNVNLYKLKYDPVSRQQIDYIKKFDSPAAFESKLDDVDTSKLEVVNNNPYDNTVIPENIFDIIYSEFELMDTKCD